MLARLTEGPIRAPDLPSAAGWPDDPGRAGQAAASLVADGLAVRLDDGSMTLP